MNDSHKGFVIVQTSEYDNPEVCGMFDTFEDALQAAYAECAGESDEYGSAMEWYTEADGLWIGRYYSRKIAQVV